MAVIQCFLVISDFAKHIATWTRHGSTWDDQTALRHLGGKAMLHRRLVVHLKLSVPRLRRRWKRSSGSNLETRSALLNGGVGCLCDVGVEGRPDRFYVLVFLVCVFVAFDWAGLVGRDAEISIRVKTNQKKTITAKSKTTVGEGSSSERNKPRIARVDMNF